MKCEHCSAELVAPMFCGDTLYGHAGLCCDCFDLSWGMPLEQINEERAEQGLPPLLPMTKEVKR